MSVVRKSDFAKMRNVSQGRVSQWIKAGQISGAAIIGEGRSAMIDSKLALVQLQERLSVNERFGLNGLNTNLDDVVGAPPPEELKAPILAGKGEPVVRVANLEPDGATSPGVVSPNAAGSKGAGHSPSPEAAPATHFPAPQARESEEDAAPIDARIKAEKLKQNEILTRKQELEEKTRYGAYVLSSDVTGELNRLTAEMVRIFEGCLPDLASAIAAKFQISQREVLHLLRAEFEQAREQLVAAGETAAAESE